MTLKRQAVRQQILRAAADLFRDRGYRATTLADIAARLGMSKASLYGYFAAKEEILAAISRETIGIFSRNLALISRSRLGADEKLRRVVLSHVRSVVAHRSFLTVFFSEEANLPARLARALARQKDRYDKAVEAIVEEGIRQGVFRPVPARLAVYGLLGMVNWLYKWYDPKGPLGPDDVARSYVDLLERGLLVPRSLRARELRRGLLRLQREISAVTAHLASHGR